MALQRREGPTALILTRQGLPIIDRERFASAEGLRKGGYILAGSPEEKPEIILMGSGSEVQLLLKAREALSKDGITTRVVNMPSWELFEAQPADYRKAVLPLTSPHGWRWRPPSPWDGSGTRESMDASWAWTVSGPRPRAKSSLRNLDLPSTVSFKGPEN
ncbi:MAG: transketolase C-terminal domain-containing protein [Deltaproteobacteria bacterium]|nr:transketolase C-terminal domain-containing protein [Deltaproteobacteria bacterium]